MRKLRPLQIYSFFLILMLFSCQEKSTQVDVSHMDIHIQIHRFDQELSALDTNQIIASNKRWQQEYGFFYNDYMEYMLEVGSPQDSTYMDYMLRRIVKQPDFLALNQAVAKTFPNLKSQEEGLTHSFRLLKYYFPEIQIPKFYSFFSGFSVQTPIGEDYMGIGLDMFLGANSEFYPALIKSIPLYISKRFTPDNIVPRVVESFLREDLYPQDNLDVTMLQHMVYQGKILYAMDLTLPHTADSLKIGYTAAQMDWAKHYESDIWSYFMQENLVFESDFLKIQRYFTEAPFTKELGEQQESAPKLGSFIGWMLVRKYMEGHPEVTLMQLFEQNNAQEILQESKYKGRSK